LEAARGKFVIEPSHIAAMSQGSSADVTIRESLAEGIKLGMLLAAGLALISAACAAVTIRPNDRRVITATERGPRNIGETPQQLGKPLATAAMPIGIPEGTCA
jgi:hypothetical protein